jgi:hypothetical protein
MKNLGKFLIATAISVAAVAPVHAQDSNNVVRPDQVQQQQLRDQFTYHSQAVDFLVDKIRQGLVAYMANADIAINYANTGDRATAMVYVKVADAILARNNNVFMPQLRYHCAVISYYHPSCQRLTK